MNKAIKIIISILAILLVFGLVFWSVRNRKQQTANNDQKVVENQNNNQNSQNQEEQNNNTEEIDTSDWKTYRNTKYGYELKYPNDGNVEEVSIATKAADENSDDIILDGDTWNMEIFVNNLQNKDIRTSLEDFSQRSVKNFDEKQLLKIGGENAIRLVYASEVNTNFYSFHASGDDIIFVRHKKTMYMFRVGNIYNSNELYSKIIDKILATVKFS